MDIKTLSDLSKIADLCLKKGIETIKISDGTVEFKLKDSAQPRTRKKRTAHPNGDALLETDGPSDEELLFWSSAGVTDSPNPASN